MRVWLAIHGRAEQNIIWKPYYYRTLEFSCLHPSEQFIRRSEPPNSSRSRWRLLHVNGCPWCTAGADHQLCTRLLYWNVTIMYHGASMVSLVGVIPSDLSNTMWSEPTSSSWWSPWCIDAWSIWCRPLILRQTSKMCWNAPKLDHAMHGSNK